MAAAEAKRLERGETGDGEENEESYHDNDEAKGGAAKEHTKVELSLKPVAARVVGQSVTAKRKLSVFEENEEDDVENISSSVNKLKDMNELSKGNQSYSASAVAHPSSSSYRSQLEILMEEEEARKRVLLDQDDKRNRYEHWLHPGIQVKILNKSLGGGKYYGCKGTVLRVVNQFVGEVLVDTLDTSSSSSGCQSTGCGIIRIDQEHLQTVVPKVHPQNLQPRNLHLTTFLSIGNEGGSESPDCKWSWSWLASNDAEDQRK
jgi:hypothetical protein